MDFKDTLDNLKDRATDLAQAGVAQSKRLAEIAKLKVANMSEEDAIKKAYLEIGKLYYAEQGAAPDGAYAAACERITAAKAALEANNDRIAQLKQPGDPEVEEIVEAAAEEAAEAAETAAEAVETAAEEVAEAVETAAEEAAGAAEEAEKQD